MKKTPISLFVSYELTRRKNERKAIEYARKTVGRSNASLADIQAVASLIRASS